MYKYLGVNPQIYNEVGTILKEIDREFVEWVAPSGDVYRVKRASLMRVFV